MASETKVCWWCQNAFSPSTLQCPAWGPVTLGCGHRFHPACARTVLVELSHCNCIKACEVVRPRLAEAETIPDIGDKSAVAMWAIQSLTDRRIKQLEAEKASALGGLISKFTGAASVKEKKIEALKNKATPPKDPIEKPSSPGLLEPVMHNGIEVTRKTLDACVQRRVPLDLLVKKSIPFTELERQFSIDTVLMVYTLHDFADRVDPTRPWEQLVNMGLKYTHLQDKERMPPELIAKWLHPSPLQFLNLFRNPEIEKLGDGESIEEKRASVYKDTPFDRFKSLHYSPQEMQAVGITAAHLVTILQAPADLYWNAELLQDKAEQDAARELCISTRKIHAALKEDSKIIV